MKTVKFQLYEGDWTEKEKKRSEKGLPNPGNEGKIVFDGWYSEEMAPEVMLFMSMYYDPIPGKTVTEKDPGEDGKPKKKEKYQVRSVFEIFDPARHDPKDWYKKEKKGVIMMVLLPEERPFAAVVDTTLASLQRCVKGYIEITYPFRDNCLVIGNDEAKLLGMEGNRHINGEVYAGPLLIAGDDGKGGFTDLTPSQIEYYMEKFYVPEFISPKAVEDSIKMDVYAI